MSHDVAIAVIVGTGRIEELIVPHIRVEEACTRQVAQYHAESNRQQKQGLILFLDGKIEQEATDEYHDGILPSFFLHEEGDEAHLADEVVQALLQVEVSRHHWHSHEKEQEKTNILFHFTFYIIMVVSG